MVKYTGLGPKNMGEEVGDCSINQCSLIMINALYMTSGVIIVAVSGAMMTQLENRTAPIAVALLGAVLSMGLWLMILAGLGWFAAFTKRTKYLVIYAYMMSLLFLIHFPISVATIAVDYQVESHTLRKYWCHNMNEGQPNTALAALMSYYDCTAYSPDLSCMHHGEENMTTTTLAPDVEYCEPFIYAAMSKARLTVGSISLTFAMTEIAGVVFAIIYRNKILKLWMKKDGMSEEML